MRATLIVGAMALLILMGTLVARPLMSDASVTFDSGAPLGAGQPNAEAAHVETDGGVPERIAAHWPAVASTAPALGETVTLTGRCLDEDGRPLCGGRAVLRVGGRVWSEGSDLAETVLDDEGVFRFVAPRSVDIAAVRLDHPRYAPVCTSVVCCDRDVDYGRLVLARGHEVTGRVVTVAGAACPGVRLTLAPDRPPALGDGQPSDRRGAPVVCPADVGAVTAADGSFSLRCGVGLFRVAVGSCFLVSPSAVHIPSESDLPLEFVVEDPASLPRIHGVVVDAAGRQIANARVVARDPEGKVFQATTGPAGDFVLTRGSCERPLPVDVRAVAREHSASTAMPPVEWGRTSLTLTLMEPGSIALEVVSGAARTPATQSRVWWCRAEGSLLHPRAPWRALAVADVEAGRATLRNMPAGDYSFFVAPADELYAGVRGTVSVGPGRKSTAVFCLAPRVERLVEVRCADGNALAGCRVELCEPIGASAGALTKAAAIHELTEGDVTNGCLLVDVATTDGSGRALIDGPAGTTLRLRVRGPGIATLDMVIDDLAGAEPLRLTLHRSGRVVFVPSSPKWVEAWRVASPGHAQFRVTLAPCAAGPSNMWPIGGSAHLSTVGPVVVDVPAGRWRPSVHTPVGRVELAAIDVESGSERTVVVDTTPYEPVLLQGRVVRMGATSGHPLRLLIERLDVGRSGKWVPHATLDSDGDGRFATYGVRAPYRVSALQGGSHHACSPPEVHPVPGVAVETVFSLSVGSLRLQLRGPDGAPLRGARFVRLLRADGEVVAQGSADSNGSLSWTCELGTFDVSVLPQRLQSIPAQVAFCRSHGGLAALESQRLHLGRVVLAAPRLACVLDVPRGYFE